MTATAKVQVQGVKETLKALKQIDPELRKAAVKEMRTAAQPLVSEVKAGMPDQPLSGWKEEGELGWRTNKVKQSVKLKFGGRKIRGQGGNQYPLLRLVIGSPAGAAFDKAGRRNAPRTPQGQSFINALTRKYGSASRRAWPATEKHMDSIQRGVLQAVDKAAAEVNKEIRRVN